MTAKVSDMKKIRQLLKRCRWNVKDSVLLFMFLGCTAALITTITLIWFPYLQTSQFVPATCTPTTINRVKPMQCTNMPGCQTIPGDYERSTLIQRSTIIHRPSLPKTIYPLPAHTITEIPNFTIPENFTYDYDINFVTAPTLNFTLDENTTFPNITFNPTTPSVTFTVPPINPTGVVRLCPWFPCLYISVNYVVTAAGNTYSGNGVLHSSYEQLQAYPQCSYSSCSSNFLVNAKVIAIWLTNYTQSIDTKASFVCYVNTVDDNKIILDKQFTYGIAINSVLWPALGSAAFLVMLIAHQCYLYSLPPKPPKEKSSSGPVSANGVYPPGQTIIYENGSVHSAEGGCGHRCVCGRPLNMLPSIAEEEEESELESVVIEGIKGPVITVHTRSSWKGSPPLNPRSPLSQSPPIMMTAPVQQQFRFDTKETDILSCNL